MPMQPNPNVARDALKRLQNFKTPQLHSADPLGEEMLSFFKQSVQKRQTKLARIAECWGAIVPEVLNDHCALESLNRGSLTVIVDSSPHLYELKQLLLAGLEKQLLLACRSAGLRKITLKAGRWYDAGDGPSQSRKVRFDES
jgi:hypothetical protein